VVIDAGYFAVGVAEGPAVLALEAGAEYRAPAARLATTFWTAAALSAVLGVAFFAILGRSLGALERARLAYGRAERLVAIGQMAAMVAHEVRNPLGILRAQVELLRERVAPSTSARERERFGEMLAEIDRLTGLTSEFLLLARDAPLEEHDCDLAELLERIVERARHDPAGAEANLSLDAPADIDVRVDPGKLEQAVFNLIVNAAQIGGPGVAVSVTARRDGDAVRIAVADDGPGVPPELRDTLFEPFVGARTGGSGVGLAVARRVAERHGGRLVLERPAGRGAVFALFLPRTRSSAPPAR
jgi:two-component system OmpR family sensor kinase